MVGIYKIENKLNGHKYIGQSVNIERRWKDEKRVAFDPNANGYDYYLSRAFRKYGLENFTFEVIEKCPQSELNDRERYWIHFYNSYYDGYNSTLGGDNQTSANQKETTVGIILDLKNTDLYHREIAEKWGVSVETVQGINTGRYWFSEYESYPLQTRHKEHVSRGIEPKKWYCIDCGKEVSKGSIRCGECYAKFSRKVERPSKEELEKRLFELRGNFTQAGREYGVTDNSVRKWCDSYGISRSSKDYKPQTQMVFNPNKGRTITRPVLQIDIATGNTIARFTSLEEAARAINKPGGGTHISDVCKGKRKSAYGYSWQYAT